MANKITLNFLPCWIIYFFSIFFSNCFSQENSKIGLKYYKKIGSVYSIPDSMFHYAELAYFYLKHTKNKNEIAESLTAMAIAKYYLGEHLESKKYTEIAAEYIIKNIGKKNRIYINILNILAAHYVKTNDYDKAKTIYQKAININKSEQFSISDLSVYYVNLGVLHLDYDKTPESIECFKNAIRLMLSIEGFSQSNFAATYTVLGNAFLKKNDLKSAKKNILKGLSFINNSFSKYDSQTKLNGYQGLGKVYLEENNSDSTLFYLLQFEEIIHIHGTQFQKLYDNYVLSGKLHTQLNNLSAADTAYNKAIQSAKDWFKDFKKQGDIANMHLKKAQYYHQYKTLQEALPLYQEALIQNSPNFDDTSWKENPDHTEFLNPSYGLEMMTDKAQILFDLYQETKEIEYLEEATEVCDLTTQLIFHIRKTRKAAEAKLFLSGKVVPFYELAILIALEMKEQTDNREYLDQAFQYAESNKALLLLEAMAKNKALQTEGFESEKIRKEQDLQQEIAYYQKKIGETKQKKIAVDDNEARVKNEGAIKELEGKLFDTKEAHGLLLDTLENEFPEIYAQNNAFKALSGEQIRNQYLSSNSAAIEFFVGEEYVFAFLLHEGGIEVLKNKDIELLKTSVQNIREILKSPPRSKHFKEHHETFAKEAHFVYQELLQPLLSKLPTGFFATKIENLTIIPDGFLSFIPFEILLTQPANLEELSFHPADLNYLLEEYSLSYQYSANLLQDEKNKQNQKDNLKFLGFAPMFGSEAIAMSRDCIQEELYGLHCNQGEIEAIQRMVSGEARMAMDADTTAFLTRINDVDILHLATHVCMDAENPKNSKIFFTDGHLTAYDLVGMQFENELTVLSACNTGNGKLMEGEGVLSLAREFTLAGSKSTLTSFWTVDDCSTSAIMENYYKHLITGVEKDEALKKAKFDFLETADMEMAHPYYWAAFLQFGSVDALYGQPFQWMYLLIVGLVLVGLFGFMKKFSSSTI